MEFSLEELNVLNKGTLMEHLNISYVEINDNYIIAKMPVNETTFQPDKILHGGANLALAETVAGLGSSLLVDLKKISVRGAQVSANHVGTANKGFVFAHGNLIHKGRYTHVWNVDIKDKNDKLISICRITNILVKK
ncbi:MAG: thioesterase [Lentimicrobiaceae bacterium]|jgi:1,4-dihydroxy-2-naphthoyl-CoA hydrolase|nr:thioesterase [Lentimicrobiaceae bacterium]MDG1901383.1 PaaI family thioesterase [Bacteroidales bacterium]MDG2080917.1 PaaI family thioesterase [Bacteroidales bacterium]|tara:strand:- start:13432 stop:13839 length:408 start_codon:yes stop_codon:yes gene_type:complete